MNARNRRRSTVIGVSGLSLAIAGAVAPGAFAAETVDGDVKVSNTETVQIQTNASGEVGTKRIYDQLVLTGNGKVDISNPVSTDGLRNLDGFGGFDVRDGKVRVNTSVDGTKKFRSVSTFTKQLPLDIKVTYTLDGKRVEPGDVVGKSGELEVRYVVTNTTGTTEDVTYKNGAGAEVSAPEKVVVPMVASMTTVLPPSFSKVRTDGANAAGDGRGGTQLSFTMTLIPPIGKATAEIGYKAQVKDAVVPAASVSALPVDPLQNTSFATAATGYSGGAETGQDLTAGATLIDSNVLKLRDGASDLVDGIIQLRDGADKLSAGLQKEAAPGAKKLADGADKLDAGAKKLSGGTGDLSDGASQLKKGAGQLSDGTDKLSAGANKLNKGASDLSDGLKTAAAGGPALLEGVAQLKAGAERVDAGLVKLQGAVAGGVGSPSEAKTLRNGVAQLVGGLAGVDKGLSGLDGGLTNLGGGINNADGALAQALALANSLDESVPQKKNLVALIGGTRDGLTKLSGGVSDLKKGVSDLKTGVGGLSAGANALDQGLVSLGAQVGAGIGTPTSTVPGPPEGPSLRNGVGQLIAGLTKLEDKGGELSDGLKKLNAGAGQLKAGTGDLSKGAGDLDAGAGKLAAGTGDLKAGADKLNAGAGTLKGGTGQLSDGATKLSDGLGTAATGSGQLAAGLGTAAKSAPALPEGAERLSKEGTSQLVQRGDATASDFGKRYALLEAGAKRAASAQPYGSPEGATALTAYKYEIAGETGEDSANLKRGIAAVALLAMAGVAATIRRRRILG
jgi:putative membrane protein